MGQLYYVRSEEMITTDRTLRLYVFINKHRLSAHHKYINKERVSSKVTQLMSFCRVKAM